jgi:hypothetical protein
MIDRNQVNGTMPLETPFPFTGNMLDACFDLLFRALPIAAVIGHIQNAAGLKLGKYGGIFFDDDEHGTGFAPPYFELIERMRFVDGKFDAVKISGLDGRCEFADGFRAHFNGCHDNSSGIQVSAQVQWLTNQKANVVP